MSQQPETLVCEKGFVHEHQSKGHELNLRGKFPVYVTDPSGTSSPTKAVILAYDIHGFHMPNSRKFVDRLASEGDFLVVMPDFLRDPPCSMADDRDKFRQWAISVVGDRALDDLNELIDYLKTERHVDRIGIIGFCWGGKQALLAAARGESEIAAAVSVHGSRLAPEAVQRILAPTLILHAEKDAMYTPELIKSLVETVEAKQKEHHDHQKEFSRWKVFPGQTHGFALRGNPEDEGVVRAANEAFEDSLAWFKAHL